MSEMKKSLSILEIHIDELLGEDATLVSEARKATELSYSPYSKFAVGAAILLDNGEVLKGANQENASYPVGICAERSVIAMAQNLWPNVPVLSLAIAAKNSEGNFTEQYVTPCGMCRQTIAELEKRYQRNVRILMCSAQKVAIVESINTLLPLGFS